MHIGKSQNQQKRRKLAAPSPASVQGGQKACCHLKPTPSRNVQILCPRKVSQQPNYYEFCTICGSDQKNVQECQKKTSQCLWSPRFSIKTVIIIIGDDPLQSNQNDQENVQECQKTGCSVQPTMFTVTKVFNQNCYNHHRG